MIIRPQFIDISSFQPASIDWNMYDAWARIVDKKARVSLRSSEGVGFPDSNYAAYRKGFENAGGECTIHYHYAYPQFNSATREAAYQASVIGAIRPTILGNNGAWVGGDIIMLDYEEDNASSTAQWALDWLNAQKAAYPHNMIVLYSYTSFITSHLQDSRLASWPLVYANWQFDPNETPPVPAPWSSYWALQYTDAQTGVPGVAGSVDADVYLEMATPPPDYVLQSALIIWNSILGSVNTKTGIFTDWLANYRKMIFRGPPLTAEFSYSNWNGTKGVAQIFPGGQYEYINGQLAFFPYS